MLSAFLVTAGIAVPAAWHVLGADIEVDGKLLRPHAHAYTIDDTRVTLAVDRALVTTGDTVTATLVAYGHEGKKIPVDVRLADTELNPGERVEPPTEQIAMQSVVLEADPKGGKPVEVKLKLGRHTKFAAITDRFLIYASPHNEAPFENEHGDYGKGWGDRFDWDRHITAGRAAAVAVLGWSGDTYPMTVAAEGPVVRGKPFVVAVRVTNTTDSVLAYAPRIELATADDMQPNEGPSAKSDDDAAGSADGSAADDKDVVITALDETDPNADAIAKAAGDDGSGDAKLDRDSVKRGEINVQRFLVAPKRNQKDIALAVYASSPGGDIGAPLAQARDVAVFHATDAAPDAKPPQTAQK